MPASVGAKSRFDSVCQAHLSLAGVRRCLMNLLQVKNGANKNGASMVIPEASRNPRQLCPIPSGEEG